jgi:hypothetical protein
LSLLRALAKEMRRSKSVSLSGRRRTRD